MKRIPIIFILIQVLAGVSFAAEWSPWYKLADGALNGIEFSFKDDCPSRDSTTCNRWWRFSSAYETPVTVESVIVWEGSAGSQKKRDRLTLKPGVNSSPAFTLYGAIDEVTVRVIADERVLDEARQEVAAEQERKAQEKQHKVDEARRAEEARQAAEAQRQEAARQAAEEQNRQEEQEEEDREYRRAQYRQKEQAVTDKRKAEKARKDKDKAAKKAADARQAELDRLEQARAEEHRQHELAQKLRRIDEESEKNKRRIAREKSEQTAKTDRHRAERDKKEQERLDRERAVREQAAKEQKEKQRLAQLEEERSIKERAEKERKEKERLDRERAKAEERAKQEKERLAAQAAEKADKKAYLAKIASGTRLQARTCPGGEGKYYLTGTYPQVSNRPVSCVDVSYRATCPGDVVGITGIATSFTGISTSCYMGDTVVLEPKPGCPVEKVRIQVLSVTPCK